MSEPEETLASRIEAARQRSTAAAEDVARRARGVIEDHPVAAVAGGVVIGALIAAAFARRRRNKGPAEAAPAETASPLIGRIGAVAGQIALNAAKSLAETGKDGAGRAQHGADVVGKAASETLSALIARFTKH